MFLEQNRDHFNCDKYHNLSEHNAVCHRNVIASRYTRRNMCIQSGKMTLHSMNKNGKILKQQAVARNL